VKYVFIAQHKKTWPIDLMCRVLGVKRNGYYRYHRRSRDQEDDSESQGLLNCVKEIDVASDHNYGSRRMQKALNERGYTVGRYKARSLMKEVGVQVRYRKKYKVTTQSDHAQPVFDNVLDRQFEVDRPDQVYVSDITYIWTQQGWLYLAVVIDLFSRKVVGWSMSTRMTAQLVCDALTMAIWQRRPEPGLIHHSDPGSQYACHAFRRLLATHGFQGSMSRKGNCWDNAVAESFFGSLKRERVQWRHYQTRQEAQQDILNYIAMFYNPYRLHSYLDYKSPNQYEAEMSRKQKAA
jgi:transposase InsO family protein